MTQHINIGDRFTTIGEHRNVDQHPATVMARSEQTRATALDSSIGSPVRSASRRNPTLPAWATTPVPSPVTDKPADYEIYGVPSSLKILRRRNPKFPAGQALPSINTHTTTITRERCGLTSLL